MRRSTRCTMDENKNPLVSIIVITYNSAKYVLETLESAKTQTYQNIELIISDDCSTDNTVEICRKWMAENKQRFVRTELITAEINTGIAPNCNRGVNAANGEWVKLIAGDDMLTENSIEQFIVHTQKWSDAKFLFGKCSEIIDGKTREERFTVPNELAQGLSLAQHIFMLKHGMWMSGPSSFMNVRVIKDLGAYDERIPFSEDWPLYMKATHEGNKLYFCDFICAYYRISNSGIYTSQIFSNKINKKLKDSITKTYKFIILPYLKEQGLFSYIIHVRLIILKDTLVNYHCPSIFVKIVNLFDPIFWLRLYIKLVTGRNTIFK